MLTNHLPQGGDLAFEESGSQGTGTAEFNIPGYEKEHVGQGTRSEVIPPLLTRKRAGSPLYVFIREGLNIDGVAGSLIFRRGIRTPEMVQHNLEQESPLQSQSLHPCESRNNHYRVSHVAGVRWVQRFNGSEDVVYTIE